MRPVRLELKGFSTYRERTIVDFTDLDLVAFVGPTGSGKSTIIDGITFALYGSIARYKSSNLVAPVVNQLSNEARVRLDFTVGPTEYTAVRVVRRTAKGATTKEARLESDGVVLAGNSRELDRQIESVIGLDFDQFTKTVVLPQGDFARFLTETPEARQGLLRRLLGMDLYRAMGSAARERAKAAEAKHSALAEQLGDRPTVSEGDVAEAQVKVDLLEASNDEIVDHARQLAIAETEASEERSSETSASEHVKILRALKVPAAAKRLEKATRTLDTKRTAARAVAETTKSALAEALAATERIQPVSELQHTMALHMDATRLRTELAEAVDHARAAEKAADDAATVEQEATRLTAERVEEREDGRRRAGAAALRDVLAVGEPCPVCEQIVDHVPTHDMSDELSALDAAVEQARRLADEALAASRAAQKAEAEAKAEVRSLEDRINTAAEALDGATDLESTKRTLDEALAVQAALDAVRTEAEVALVALQEIDEAYAELEEQEADLRRGLTATRDRLVALEPPAPGETSVTGDWSDLADWAATALDDAKDTKIAAATKARAAEKDAKRHRSAITKALAKLAGAETIDDPLTWLAAEHARRSSDLDVLRAEHEAQQRTANRMKSLHREATVAGELGRLLSARGFEKWLMADVMHTLAARATDRLFELSDGAYSLLTDGTDFSITDHRNADETRSARTLSGGETFLASLALALALADNIADLATEGAPAIESMFLDEGFGTLDTDTLDVVASAIEELGAEGRMIGVVTHIRDLADRIPARFEVARTPNGSTVARTTLD